MCECVCQSNLSVSTPVMNEKQMKALTLYAYIHTYLYIHRAVLLMVELQPLTYGRLREIIGLLLDLTCGEPVMHVIF